VSSADAVSPLEQAKRFKLEVDRAVTGQWETALSVLAPDLADAIEQGLRQSPRHVSCPVHGGKDGFRLFADWRESGGGVCNTCGKFGDGFALLMWLQNGSFADTVRRVGEVFGIRHPEEAGQKDRASLVVPTQRIARPPSVEEQPAFTTLSEFGRQLWSACDKLQGTAVAYLEARNCVIPPADGDLRFHPALRHPISGDVGPALVGLITDFVTGEPLSLHRTWIRADGRKAEVDPPRMYLGRHRKQGGVVRLWPDDAVTQGLALAEGIETALSVAHGITPVWAAIDAGNLAALAVLPGISALTIAADQDKAGLAAAHECAERWHRAGCEVRIVVAPPGLNDLNDLAVAA